MNPATETKFQNAEHIRSAFFVALNSSMHPTRFLPLILLVLSFFGASQLAIHANAQEESQEQSQVKTQDETAHSPQKIKKWIAELESPTFLVREQAKNRLKTAGAAAFSQLYRARDTDDLEAKLLIEELISQIKIQWIGPRDSQRVIDLMLDFQTRQSQDRLAVVDRLSWFSQKESWESLYRIAIYDKSPEVSSYAAARLLQICFLRDEQPSSMVQRNYRELSADRYVSARSLQNSDASWGERMIAICFALANRENSIINLDELILPEVENQIEVSTRWTAAGKLSPQLLESFLIANRVLYRFSEKLSDNSYSNKVFEGLDQATLRLVNEKSTIDEVATVLDSLLSQSRFGAAEKAFDLVDKTKNPWHGFWKSEILRRQNQEDAALEFAREVYKKLPTGNEPMAEGIAQLSQWQLHHWSAFILKEREGTITDRLRFKLAELEFRLGDKELAKKWAVQVFTHSESNQDKLQSSLLLSEIAAAQKQPRVELGWLSKMLKLDPLSVVALVKMNRLAETSQHLDKESFRQKLDIAMGAYRDQFRLGSQMAQSSTPAEANLGRVKMASAANSLAWLLFNLGEETKEATRMAETAVQLEPRNAEFLDTLAFGEFQFGSKEKAISLQKRAVFLSPGDRDFRERLEKYTGRN